MPDNHVTPEQMELLKTFISTIENTGQANKLKNMKVLSVDEINQITKIVSLLDSPEEMKKIEKLLDNADILLNVAEKERNWIWLTKSLKSLALWITAVLAGLFAAYEAWVRLIVKTVNN